MPEIQNKENFEFLLQSIANLSPLIIDKSSEIRKLCFFAIKQIFLFENFKSNLSATAKKESENCLPIKLFYCYVKLAILSSSFDLFIDSLEFLDILKNLDFHMINSVFILIIFIINIILKLIILIIFISKYIFL